MKIGMPSDLTHEKFPSHENLPICGVVATAVACDVPFTVAYKYYSNSKRGNWKGTLELGEILKGISHFGAKLTNAKWPGCKTLADFIALISIHNPDKVYLVTTTGHIQVVKGRHVVDQSGYKDIINYRWKRKLVDGVWIIESRSNAKLTPVDISIQSSARKKDTRVVAAFIVNAINNKFSRDAIISELMSKFNYKKNTAMVYYYTIKKEMK